LGPGMETSTKLTALLTRHIDPPGIVTDWSQEEGLIGLAARSALFNEVVRPVLFSTRLRKSASEFSDEFAVPSSTAVCASLTLMASDSSAPSAAKVSDTRNAQVRRDCCPAPSADARSTKLRPHTVGTETLNVPPVSTATFVPFADREATPCTSFTDPPSVV